MREPGLAEATKASPGSFGSQGRTEPPTEEADSGKGAERDYTLLSALYASVSALNESAQSALDDARQLIALGIPVFTCRLTREGNPLPPNGWEKTRPSMGVLDRWRPGQGLCAVTGVVYDVLDIDPRNGGMFSANRMGSDLGDDGPDIFWRVRTPSGGLHFWIAPLGLGTHQGFMNGLDLKGGKPDGSSRGFVFIPPTVRPSKEDGVRRQYTRTIELSSINGAGPSKALRRYINERLEERLGERGGGGRSDPEQLAQDCRDAEAGEQREALLRYTHELERMGTSRTEILGKLKDLVAEMPVYDKRNPWRERDLRALLHRPGTVIGDAAPGEVDGIKPITAGLVRPISSLADAIVSWLWPGYLAFRELTIVDGEKAVGKTLVVFDVAARASIGRAMPGQPEAVCGKQRIIIFGDEGHIESVTKPRLIAAGCDEDMIFIPAIKVPKRGDKSVDWELALPNGAPLMAKMINEAGAGLAIFDPITDFLDESIQTHNDASVRRALRPLALELSKTGAAGLAIRHMNKQTGLAARYRGQGSAAFQNRARVHLVAVPIPTSQRMNADGKYALAMVDSNMAVKQDGALTYSIVDSEVPMDDLGNMVGMVKWHGYADIDVLSPEGKRHGPANSPERDMATELIADMFQEKDTWPKIRVDETLKAAGVKVSHITLNKIRDELGIRPVATRRRGAIGVSSWSWTTRKPSAGGSED